MPKSPFARRDEERELSRRSLIRWTLAAGVGLGVSRTKVHEILEKHAGKGAALAASKLAVCRSIHIHDGGGGLANWTQIFPNLFWATNNTATTPWAKGNDGSLGTPFVGTPKPLLNYNGNPFATIPVAKQVSCFTAGANNTHNSDGNTSTFGLGGVGLAAFAAKIQATSVSAVLPALSIGSAQGPSAVPFASANNAAGAVNLFNSAASQTGGILNIQSNADLFAAHYDILSALNRVAKDPVQAPSYKTARDSARFIAKNLAAQLTVSAAELAEYGTGGSNALNTVRQDLAFSLKAFALGLTNCIALRGFRNDPHGYFDGGTSATESQAHRKMLETFFAKMAATTDPVSGEKLLDNFVFVVQGDTPKSATNTAGWGDGSSQNSNLVFAYTSGWVKAGWHGQINGNTATSVDDAGNPVAYNGAEGARKALACLAYAICKGDDRAAAEFTGNTVYKAGVNTALL